MPLLQVPSHSATQASTAAVHQTVETNQGKIRKGVLSSAAALQTPARSKQPTGHPARLCCKRVDTLTLHTTHREWLHDRSHLLPKETQQHLRLSRWNPGAGEYDITWQLPRSCQNLWVPIPSRWPFKSCRPAAAAVHTDPSNGGRARPRGRNHRGLRGYAASAHRARLAALAQPRLTCQARSAVLNGGRVRPRGRNRRGQCSCTA